MNKREAKKSVCMACARILLSSADGPGEWLHTDGVGNELPQEDQDRMRKAFDELIDELFRRGIGVS